MEKGLLLFVVVCLLVVGVVGESTPSLLSVKAERTFEVSGWQKGASVSIFFELSHPLNESSESECLPDFLVKIPPQANGVKITDSLGNIFVETGEEMQTVKARYPICPGWKGDVILSYFISFLNENDSEQKVIEIPPLVIQSANLLSTTTNIILPEGGKGREVRENREGEGEEKVDFEEELGPYSLLGWSPRVVLKIGETNPSSPLIISYDHESRFLLRLPLSLFTLFCLILFSGLATKQLLFPQVSSFEEREVKELLKRISTNFEQRIDLVDEKETALDESIDKKKKSVIISLNNKFQSRQEALQKEGHASVASLVRISAPVGKFAKKADASLTNLEKQQDVGLEIDMDFYFNKKLNAREHAQLQYGSDQMKKLYRKEYESSYKPICY